MSVPRSNSAATDSASKSKPKPKTNSERTSPTSASRKPAATSAATRNTGASADAAQLVDERIRAVGGWRGQTLARVRTLIREADPAIVEAVKWRGTPVWSHDGIVCTGEAYAKVVKLTFAKGAKLADPARLFNSSLDGNARRAIDLREGETIDAAAFKALVKAAVAQNGKGTTTSMKKKSKPSAGESKMNADEARPQVRLLSGGNPQIAKGDGDAPVQAYIAAMPGWKRGFGERLDALITRTVPDVRKAVRWNSPFYGVEGRGWFVSFHVFTRYVKVTFFAGTSLRPIPPGGTPKSKEVRWIDVFEDPGLDEAQMTTWVKQAAALPGWDPSKPS